MLIKSGTDLDRHTDKDESPLFMAVYKGFFLMQILRKKEWYEILINHLGNSRIIEFLIKSGANINLADITGKTPLAATVNAKNRNSF